MPARPLQRRPGPSPGNAGAEPLSPGCWSKDTCHPPAVVLCPAQAASRSVPRTHSSGAVGGTQSEFTGDRTGLRLGAGSCRGPGTTSRPGGSLSPTVLAGGGPRDRRPETQSHSELLPLQLRLTQHLRD